MRLSFRVHGLPAPQGSKRYVGRGIMIEASKKVKPWRSDVVNAARQAIDPDDWAPIEHAVSVNVEFAFRRPKSHYGTGKNAGHLKLNAPRHVTSMTTGDLDKLLRSTNDALVAAGILADDRLITEMHGSKCYASESGAYIEIETLT